ncbi:hypothetical protein P3L10_010578 [Capsicum annuum]
MFEQDNQVVMDNDTSGCGHAVHHGSDLYREIHKDATDKREIGTSKSSLDGDEIKNYINKCFAEKMAELVTLISKIPAEIVKALKNEENKQSQEDKIDEQQQSQEDGSNKKERQHKSDMKGSLNEMEVSRGEESNKQHLLEEQQLLNVNAADKEAGREDNFKNEDCSDLQSLEDEIMAYEEECSDEELGKRKFQM